MKFNHLFSSIEVRLNQLSFLGPLLARVTLGLVFFQSGQGKLTHMARTIEYFGSLGIPHPELQAPFVAGIELVGGALLILGLATRVAAAPLMGVMVVALKTAKWEEVTDFSSLLGLSEFLYLVLLVGLTLGGPGSLSLDWFISRKDNTKFTP